MARRPHRDTRLEVARYQVDRLSESDGEEDDTNTAGQTTMEQHAHFVEIQIQQAMRRGDFDDLPGAGKPIPGLGQAYDPDWWIRKKIERENLSLGTLAPPALTLRTENAALDDQLAAARTEQALLELLENFNRRVIEARRQLLGGPPVVTPTRDIEAELTKWRERRDERMRAAEVPQEKPRRRSRWGLA